MALGGCRFMTQKPEANGSDGGKRSNGHVSHDSHAAHHRPVIQPRGDYMTLLSYQKAEVVYDITFRFAHKYLGRGNRTVDQMIQSARLGKQNPHHSAIDAALVFLCYPVATLTRDLANQI